MNFKIYFFHKLQIKRYFKITPYRTMASAYTRGRVLDEIQGEEKVQRNIRDYINIISVAKFIRFQNIPVRTRRCFDIHVTSF